MVNATFKIDGTEFVQHLQRGGIKWSRNDIDEDGSGRTLDGVMHRSRIAVKRKLTVSMPRLTQSQLQAVAAALAPEFVDVTYIDPQLGETTKTFYGSQVDSTTQRFIDGEAYWVDTTFSLIEK